MWQSVPDNLNDDQRLVNARLHESTEINVWDEGWGELWVYRESLGVCGVVRARSWEAAWECVVDEIMDDADLDADEQAEVEKTGELPEGCHWRANGVPSNPRLHESIACEDLNGVALDRLTPTLAEHLSLDVDLEDDWMDVAPLEESAAGTLAPQRETDKEGHMSTETMPPFRVGNLVRLGHPWLDNPTGTIAICYETFTDREGDPGMSLLFPNGTQDTFSPRGVERFKLEIVGHVPELEQYEFTDERQVVRDFHAGRFAMVWTDRDKEKPS